MRPWGLIFDVDGVIADTEALNARASVLMFAELYGVTVRPEDFQPFIGAGDDRYVGGVAEQYGVGIDVEAAVARRAEDFFKLLHDGPLPAAPGVRERVAQARATEHVKLAIATSGRKDKQFPVIQGTGLRLEWFDDVITGDDVTRKKPDPEIYRLAGQRLGLPPLRCVVIEDAPVGVQAARGAGMRCVAVLGSAPREALADADLIVENLAEVSVERLEERFGL